MGATESRVAGVTQWMRLRQGAVQNGGGFRRKNFSALDYQPWSNLRGKLKKPLGLELRTCEKLVVLTCILRWLGTCGEVFMQCLMITLSSKMCHQPSYSPSLPGASCLKVSGGNHWKSCGVRAKLASWDGVMLVGLLSVWEKGYFSCWTTWPWCWVLQSAAVVLQISTTLVARSVSCLLPRSPSLSADGSRLRVIPPTSHLVQCVTVQECTLMWTTVGRLHRSQLLTRSYLPSSLPKPREFQVKKHNLETRNRKDGYLSEDDAKMEVMFELVCKLQRQSRLVSTLSSASRFGSSRTEPPQPRFWAALSRSTSL